MLLERGQAIDAAVMSDAVVANHATAAHEIKEEISEGFVRFSQRDADRGVVEHFVRCPGVQ
jgi:hypothetical protein